ncbi:MAG: OmpA family protein [Bacteroidales bacterium]|nr:OmpA family protein [Bacteroidales bacterium]
MRVAVVSAVLCALFGVSMMNAQSKYTDAEGDALIQRLNQADTKILELEQKLRDCTMKCEEESLKANVPLATIYFSIGSSEVTNLGKTILDAVANVIKTTDDRYVVTGWADDYTGSEAINEKLRKYRVENVKRLLVKAGVDENRLKVVVKDGNLVGRGEKSAALDRAVTIKIDK